jgi:hypothetical protein
MCPCVSAQPEALAGPCWESTPEEVTSGGTLFDQPDQPIQLPRTCPEMPGLMGVSFLLRLQPPSGSALWLLCPLLVTAASGA